MNRDRIRGSKGEVDCMASLTVLFSVLLDVTILFSPITPFLGCAYDLVSICQWHYPRISYFYVFTPCFQSFYGVCPTGLAKRHPGTICG